MKGEPKANSRGLPLIKPMEPVLIRKIPSSMDYLAQVKWDGVRILANINNGEIQLYTRHHRLRTFTYPEITVDLQAQFPSQQLILDGECVSIKDGKADFFRILKRDRLKDSEKIRKLMREVPVTYMVFDLLYFNGEWLTGYPLLDRLKKLQSLLITTPFVQLCSGVEESERLLRYLKERRWEGMVLKEKESIYHLGKKHPSWKKLKLTQQIIASVMGVTLRSGKVNALILGVREEEAWRYIGKVSSGLSQQEMDLITEWVSFVPKDRPPDIEVPLHPKQMVWIPPYLKVEVEFLEWTPSGTLRSPVLKGYSFQE